MTTSDYILDSVLVLIVLRQIIWRRLSGWQLFLPILIVGIAVSQYFKTIPTAGNDLPVIGLVAALGLALGLGAGFTTHLRNRDGEIWARAGLTAATLWVAGMGARFAFSVWAFNGGARHIGQFDISHHIVGTQVWVTALLAMAVFEVGGRTLALLWRRSNLAGGSVLALA